MTARITQQQLESYLWGAATLLRGTIDAGDYKQFIFPLLFYKRLCDVYDEETRTALAESEGDKDFAAYPENHRFQIPPEAHWKEVRMVANNVGVNLQNALRTVETANPDKLYGIFGDAQWTNKDRLSDAMLRDLIEHFSSLELTLTNLPEDELGNGYEYLIKKFADDAGHTAAEFYTNRTVVHLMTEMLQPQPGESIYDPTCGSGGMLISCIAQLRRQGKEWRNARVYGQERNLMTSSIARMNCFLHGIEDFRIERGDTLAEPKFVQGDRLQRFDIVLANPPYSIKQWDREAFASDPWGRNIFGTPPPGRADYAFWQHIIQSMNLKSGRCAILFPHGVLFRQEENEMREKIIEADLIECILGLGPNLFYNSPMEACVVICRTAKPKQRCNKILFINAVSEVTRERAQSFLTDEHVKRIVKAYEQFKDEPGFTRVASLEEIRTKHGKLSIPLYVSLPESSVRDKIPTISHLSDSVSTWLTSTSDVRSALTRTFGEVSERLPSEPHQPAQTLPAWLKHSEWKRLPFGTFASSVNERVEPNEAEDEIYVGLEHLDPQDLHIRRWGKGSDVIGTKLRFRKGDLIFGRRRAYQRKLAVAEFDGICSAHAMVVRSNPDVVLPEFLPFLMMSDRFMNRAVEISVGSLSPTINWTTLKLDEFALPPLDQQRRIAEILWAVDEAESLVSTIESDIRRVLDASLSFSTANCPRVALSTLCSTITKGATPTTTGAEYVSEGVPFLRAENVRNAVIDSVSGILQVSHEFHNTLSRSSIKPNDVLLSIAGTIGRAGVVAPTMTEPMNCNQAVAVLRPKNTKFSMFIYYWLQSSDAQKQIRRDRVTSTISNISLTTIRNLKIPALEDSAIQETVSRLNTLSLLGQVVELHGANVVRVRDSIREGLIHV